jgi:type I restriction enzyme S subunit
MTREAFFEKFELITGAPSAIPKIRELILHLGVRGQLTSNADPCDLVRLGEALRLRRGYDLPTQFRREGSIPIYAANGPVGFHDSPAVTGPGVVTGRSGSIGKVHYVQGDFWPLNTALYVEDFFGNDPEYAVLLLRSLHLERFSTSTAVPTLNRNVVHKERIRIPPLAEQKRIVAKVNELMALCDRLEAQRKERETRHAALARAALSRFADAPTPANLTFLFHKSYTIPPADLRKSILTLAVQGKLVPQDPTDEPVERILRRLAEGKGEKNKGSGTNVPIPLRSIEDRQKPFQLPSSWEWVRLGDIAGIKHGFAFSSESFTSEPTAFILTTPGNFHEKGGFRDRGSKTKYYRGPVDPDFIFKAGDLIIPMTEQAAGLLGSPAFIPDDGKVYIHNQRLGKLEFYSESIRPEFVFWFFNCEFFRNELARTCTGMKVRHTSPRKVLSVPYPLCPVAEQRRIVAKVHQLMAFVDELGTQLAASRAAAAKLLDAIVGELTA